MAIRPLQVRVRVDGAGQATAEIDRLGDTAEESGQQAERGSQGWKSLGGALAALGIAAMVKQLVGAGVELGKMEAQLINVEGSADRGRKRFDELRQAAYAMNIGVAQAVDAYVRLRRQGLQPTAETLVGLGNLAAATGSEIETVAQAAVNAALGRTMQLSQLGVQVRDNGEQMVLTYRGTEREVERSAQGIIAALEEIGHTDHLGAAARQAGQLGGVVSEIGDAFVELANAIRNSFIFEVLGDIGSMVAEITRGIAQLINDLGPREQTALGMLGKEAAEAEAEVERLRAKVAQLEAGIANMERIGGDRQAARMRAELAEVSAELERQESLWRNIARAMQIAIQRQQEAGEADPVPPQANQALEQLIARLREQAAVYGMSREEILRHTAAQALAAGGTAEQRKEVEALVERLAALIRADEAAAAAAREKAEADREAAADAKERERAERELARALEDQERKIEELLDKLDPARRQERELKQAQDLLTAAYHQGALTLQEYLAALDKLPDALGHASKPTKELAEETDEAVGDWSAAWDRGLERLDDAFADVFQQLIRTGKLSLDSLKDFFSRWLTEMIMMAARRRIAVHFGGQGGQPGGLPGGLPGMPGPGGMSPGSMLATGLMGGGIGGMIGGTPGAIGGGVLGIVGSMFGPIGTILGGVIGGLLGSLFGRKPRLEVSGSGAGIERITTPFGVVGLGGRGVELADVGQAIQQLDATLARLLRPEEVAAVSAALRGVNYSARGSGISVEEMLSQRLQAALAAVEPQWAAFLRGFDDLEARLEAFVGLRSIRDQVDALDVAIASLSASPMEQMRTQIEALDAAVTDTAANLASAIAAQDPARIAEAGQAATQAIIQRYQAEVQAVETLVAAIEQVQAAVIALEDRARAFETGIAQRIGALLGTQKPIIGNAVGNIGFLQGRIGDDSFGLEQRLRYLDEFVSTVDAWLQATRAQVEQWRVAQEAAVQSALAALAAERNEILAGAQQRAANANAAAQRAAAAAQAAHQAAIAALQEQLRLAQLWAGVLQQVESIIQGMQFGGASPLSGFGRLSLLDAQIAQAQAGLAGLSGEQRAAALQELMQLLQQRMQLVMSEGLFDRPSGDFLDLYNQTLAELGEIREEAMSEAERLEALQEELNALQAQTVAAVHAGTATAIMLSDEEQQRLQEIADEEAELQERLQEIQAEAAERLASIDEQALEYYTWARETGEVLRAERHAELMEEMERLEDLLWQITGGLDPMLFIAERQALAASLLEDIRDDLRAFLGAVTSGSGGGVGSGPGTNTGNPLPPIGDNPRPTSVGAGVTVNVLVDGMSDPVAVQGAVREAISASLPGIASAVKGELATS